MNAAPLGAAHATPLLLLLVIVAATVGAGLMAGLLLAFSIVVMRALSELAPEQGLFAMQRINALIVTPLFLLLFLGSALLCAGIAVLAARALPATAAMLLLAGAVAYLAGPLGITLACNVPLNNRLATLSPTQAAAEWPTYVTAWLRWNHLRTALGALATALLAAGAVVAAGGS